MSNSNGRKGPANRERLVPIHYRNQVVYIASDEQGYVNSFKSGKLVAGFEIWKGQNPDDDLVRAHGSYVFPQLLIASSRNERKQLVREYIVSLINGRAPSGHEIASTVINQRMVSPQAPVVPDQTLSEFVEANFWAYKSGMWKGPTEFNRRAQVDTYLIPEFGAVLLHDLNIFMLQTFLNDLGRSHTKEVIKQIKGILGEIVHLAFKMHLMDEDFEEDLRVPIAGVVHPKILLPEVTLATFLAKLKDLESRCLMGLGVFSSTRTSEVFGLRWSSWVRPYIEVSSIAYRGKLFNETKTPESRKRIYVPRPLHSWVDDWRTVSPDCSAEALMFPFVPMAGRNKGVPRPFFPCDFFDVKGIYRLARDAGIPEHGCNFRVFRRTSGNQFYDEAALQLTQARLRHSTDKTTRTWYLDSDENRIQAIADAWCERILDLMERLPPFEC